MRVLLDNCVPVRFGDHLAEYDVETALSIGWDRKRDAELLDLMASKFEALITVDKKLSMQNLIENRSFAVITLRAKSNQMRHLLQLLPKLKAALKRAQPGSVIVID